jgi:arginase
MRSYVLIDAPSRLGLEDLGVDGSPDVLRAAGLPELLHAKVGARVEAPPFQPGRHPEHGMLNTDGIARYTPELADAIGGVLDEGAFPVVLGGDCSILLGGLLALRRRGRYGLLFIDGHADFYQPAANINGETASSDLAFATGRGPAALTRFETFDRLVRDEDVVAFGFRDLEEQRSYGSQPLPETMLSLDLPTVRRLGVDAAIRQAIERLNRPELDGFWIHLDADVMHDALMPAVDYRQPDGLLWNELTKVLRSAMQNGRSVGLELTIYNQALDPDRSVAATWVKAVADGIMSDASSVAQR